MLNYNITFYLRTTRIQDNGKAPLYARIRIANEKLELSLNQSLLPLHWNSKKERAVKCSEADLVNSIIATFTANILKAITELQLSQIEVSVDNVRKLLKGESVMHTFKLLEVALEHNANFEKQVGVKYSYGSYKNYKTTLAFLKEFINVKYKKHDIKIEQLDYKFCEQYFIWLTTEKTCQQNGAAKHIQRVKTIVNYALKLGYIKVNPIAGYSVKLKQVPIVALTWDEVQKIQALNLQTKTLQNIKNIFVFQVFTGLAYADVKALSKKHLIIGTDGRIWLRMERKKTHNTFTLPLLDPALEILQMYVHSAQSIDQPIFPVISNQKMNQNLKIIQEIAGISKSLHSHLPRHTFASTITLLNGVPLETVSKMLGHSKITMTHNNYARVGELKISNDMQHLQKRLREDKDV